MDLRMSGAGWGTGDSGRDLFCFSACLSILDLLQTEPISTQHPQLTLPRENAADKGSAAVKSIAGWICPVGHDCLAQGPPVVSQMRLMHQSQSSNAGGHAQPCPVGAAMRALGSSAPVGSMLLSVARAGIAFAVVVGWEQEREGGMTPPAR